MAKKNGIGVAEPLEIYQRTKELSHEDIKLIAETAIIGAI